VLDVRHKTDLCEYMVICTGMELLLVLLLLLFVFLPFC
jgi:ribosomal silencing factor RsfS